MKQKRVKIKTKNSKDTVEFGKKIGSILNCGDLVLVSGELGAGKTTFIKGIALGLDIDLNVKSPSFVIVTKYSGKFNLYHIDLYRIDEKEIYELGFSEFLENGVVCIEWADKLKQEFNGLDFIKVDIKVINCEREIDIIMNGEDLIKRCILYQ